MIVRMLVDALIQDLNLGTGFEVCLELMIPSEDFRHGFTVVDDYRFTFVTGEPIWLRLWCCRHLVPFKKKLTFKSGFV
jgi:hypothetical protein